LAGNIARSASDAFNHPMQALTATAVLLNKNSVNSIDHQQAELTQLVSSHNAAESAYILGSDGRIKAIAFSLDAAVQHGNANRQGLDMSRNTLFLKRNRTDAAISPVFISSVSEQLQVALTAPLRGDALLVMEMSLSGLANAINNYVADSDVRVMITDSSGQLVVNPDTSRPGESVMLPIDVVKSLSRSSTALIELNGQRWLAAAMPVGKLDWQVVVMRPATNVYAPINSIVGLLMVTTAILLVFSFAALLYATRGIQRATQTLISDARQLEQGEAPQKHAFEILELAQIDTSLRALARALLQREDLLKQANEVLEMRVLERTQHLEQVNRELQEAMLKIQATQDELVQSGKMAALGAMVAGVAHELNTPVGNARLVATTLLERGQTLSAILASGRVSRKEIEQIALDFQSAAEIIDKSLHRASELVRSFKQVAADQTSNRRRLFKLIEVVQENELLLTPRLNKAGITMQVKIDADIDMDSYPGDLGQVLTNLAENALIHAYPDGQHGSIDISAELNGTRSAVKLRVADHGMGIDHTSLGRIFDPFFTTRMGRGGTGLGLSIVYSLVTKSLDGRISVESEFGRGTTFIIELPLVAPVRSTC
jgi:signal transduction histidine kinase